MLSPVSTVPPTSGVSAGGYADQPRRHGWVGSLVALLIAGAIFFALPHPVDAASIPVDGATCTLVNAIAAANTDTATGGCSAGSGADTLVLASSSTHTLSTFNNTSSDSIRNGLPQIASNITLDGNNATIIRPSTTSAGFRIFYVTSTGALTLNNLTIQGGSIQGKGGGIANLGGAVTLNNVTFVSNAAKLTSGSGGGGGIYSSSGTVTLNDSVIHGSLGGGINVAGGSLMVNSSTVYSSIDTGEGTCGGIFINSTLVTINNSTVSGNVSATAGASVNKGGGITMASNGSLTVNNSTVTGNSSVNNGGGISVSGTGNTLTLVRTLLAGNTASSGSNELFNNTGVVTGNNYNLFGHSGQTTAQALSGFTPSGSDLTATNNGTMPTLLSNILNTTLANNGGATLTHALMTDSPAVDAAGSTGLATDQRGIARPQGAAFDIGAFEWNTSKVNTQLTQVSAGKTSSTITPDATYPSQSTQGVVMVSLTVQNKPGSGSLTNIYYHVTALTNNNWLLNADNAPGQVDSKLSVANRSLPGSNQWDAGQNLVQAFKIGLLSRNSFAFRVDVYANIVTVAAASANNAILLGSYDVTIDPATTNRIMLFLPTVYK